MDTLSWRTENAIRISYVTFLAERGRSHQIVATHALSASRHGSAFEAALRNSRAARLAHPRIHEVPHLALHASDCSVIATLARSVDLGTESAGAVRLQLVEHTAQHTVGGVGALLASLHGASAEGALAGGGVEEVSEDAVGADGGGGAQLAAHHCTLAELARIVRQQNVCVNAHLTNRRRGTRETAH